MGEASCAGECGGGSLVWVRPVEAIFLLRQGAENFNPVLFAECRKPLKIGWRGCWQDVVFERHSHFEHHSYEPNRTARYCMDEDARVLCAAGAKPVGNSA